MNLKKYDKLIGRSALYDEIIRKKEKNWKYLLLSICSFGLLFAWSYYFLRFYLFGIPVKTPGIASTFFVLFLIIAVKYAPTYRILPYIIYLADLYFLFRSLRSPEHSFTEIPLLVIIPIITYYSFPIKRASILNWAYMFLAFSFLMPFSSLLKMQPQDPTYILIIFSSFILVSILSFFSAKVYEDHIKVLKREFFFDIQTGLPGWELLKLRMAQVPNSTICLFRLLNTESLHKSLGMETVREITKKYCQNLEQSPLFRHVEIFKLSKGDLVFFWDKSLEEKSVREEIDHIMSAFGLSSILLEERSVFLKAVAGICSVEEDPSLTLCRSESALEMAMNLQQSYYICDSSSDLSHSEFNETPFQQLVECLEKDRMELYFQPIVCSNTEEVVKAEALVRFIDTFGNSLDLGPILKSAYQTGLNGRMTERVLEKASEWSVNNNVSVSVNVGFEDLVNASVIDAILKANRIIRGKDLILTLEILVSSSMAKRDTVLQNISELREEGVEIAIDDFGSGYANFDRILLLHADIIKLDGSLVRQLSHSDEARDLLRTICSLAGKNGARIVAEHVEDREILHWVRMNDIDFYQGYLFGAPAPALIREKV